jgi:hypothetical protein
VDLDQSLYALDSTTIDLCLSLFPWARFRKHKAAVKIHTLLDLHGNIPTFISITSGKVHDVNILDEILPEAGAFYVMDRGYVDFKRLYVFTLSAAFFVVRTKSNILLQRRYSHSVDKTTGVRSDHTVILTAIDSAKAYPDALRRITYLDVATRKRFKFLTNNFTLPALTIALIYKARWQVELFFESLTWCTPLGSCPKSVIDDKHFRSNELRSGGLREISPMAGDRAASGNPKQPGCWRFGTSGNWCGSGSRAGTSPRG